MNKIICVTLVSLGLTVPVVAAEYFFLPERFSSIAIVTTKGKERILVKTWTKEEDSEQTVFESRLISSKEGRYSTPNGTIFILEHLQIPIVNDDNRHINSGDWRLTIVGKGLEFEHLRTEMPVVTFGDTPRLVYLGIQKK